MKQKSVIFFVRRPRKLTRALGILVGLGSLATATLLHGADKNGVSPQAISLPTGPGSIQGLGESFQPQLNTGSGSYSVQIDLPEGPGGLSPELTLGYDTGSPNGFLGLGWSLSGLRAVARNTDDGVPLYVDGPNGVDDDLDGETDNPHELDRFTGMDQEELVPLADGSFRSENESSFLRYQRAGNGWEARSKDGTLYEFGKTPSSQIEEGGRVFKWLLERVSDLDQNTIEYSYMSHPDSPGQLYCRSIRWGRAQAFFAVVFTHGPGRPDVFNDFRSGFEVRTGLRLARIDVISQGIPAAADSLPGDLDADGIQDRLIRRYELEYHDGFHVSLLEKVTKVGRDGVTALPPVTFEYTGWTPPTNVSGTLITDGGATPPGLNSDSVELIDMNGDGLPDFLSTTAGQHRAQLNLGQSGRNLIFGPSLAVGNAPSVDIASVKTHLADSSADGAADLLVRAASDRFFCFDNTSHLAWAGQGVPLSNTDTWPLWPFDGDEGMKSRSLDADHNRANDVLHTGDAGIRLWMLSRQGQYSKEVRTAPLICDGKSFRFDLPGTHVSDINGDRLQDLVWVQSTRVVYWPNQGRGLFGDVVISNLGFTLLEADIQKAGFSDVDGDGLEDLTVVRPSSLPQGIVYWLNRFQNGFVGPSQITGLPALNANDALRWADMNGNGSSDIMISNSTRPAGQRLLVIDLVPGVRPHLLKHVENGLGLEVDMTYESSVDQMVRARASGAPWTFTMPMPVPVLARITENDGRGNINTRAITYRDPYYNAVKQEFRGFREAELRDLGDDSIETQATIHRYDTGETSDCLKGKLIETVVTDEAGNVVERSENSWSNRLLDTGIDDREICYAVTEQVDRTVLERGDVPMHLRSEMRFDDFGNEVENRNHGVLAVVGDEIFTLREFELRPAVWLMGLKKRETVKEGSRIVSDAFFTYDARGHLIRNEAWLDTENRNVVVVRNGYDAFGNLVEVIDANGHRRTMGYDPLVHAQPIVERIHLEDRTLEMRAEYDLGLGIVLRATEFTGATHSYDYDALGRITRLVHPDGVTKDIEYHVANPISHVVERTLEDVGGGTHDAFTYYDSYGRKLATKLEAEGGKWRTMDAVRFNSRKLERAKWLPHETPGPGYEEPAETEAHELYSYDVMARPVRTIRADGSMVSNVYEPLLVHFFDENDNAGEGQPRTTRRDGLDRIVEVIERNGSESLVTGYRWSALGDLVEIRDAQENRKTFDYDSLRRKISIEDPDRGAMSYAHDDAGNLLRTVDAKGQVIQRRYDFANRLVSETRHGQSGGSSLVTYSYDVPTTNLDLGDGQIGTATFTSGRLAAVVDPSGETHFSYDARGNTVWTVKRIREPRSGLLVGYRTQFAYDLLDRLTEVIYPDNDRVRYSYNHGSFLERIDGGPDGAVLVENYDRHPSSEVARVDHGNGVVSLSTYDARHRLSSLVVQGPGGEPLIDVEHAYDAASNVVRLVDRRPFTAVGRSSPRRNTQVFTYDDIHRLIQTRYAHSDDLDSNLGQIDYGHDAIGNIIARTTPAPGQPGHIGAPGVHLGAITYGGGRSGRAGRGPGDPPGPHAVTQTASGRALSYDASGNVSRLDGAVLAWDATDQLVGYDRPGMSARYVYDYSDRRVAKSVARGDRTDETLYVDQYFEERPGGTPLKYVLAGDTRVARVEGTIDPTRDRIQRLRLAQGWSALAVAVESGKTLAQVFGTDAAFYTWRNGSHELRAPGSIARAGESLWVHAPTARVVVVKGRYEPVADASVVPSGGAFIAWPRLEAFLPGAHLSAAGRIHLHDPHAGRFLLRDPSLPSFLQDLGTSLPSAGAFWIAAPPGTSLRPAARQDHEIIFYHADHLGSASVTTGPQGGLLEELAFYPFGELRHRHAAPGSTPADYDFTGKETDDESGLVYHGARFYNPSLGRFLSVDPLYGDPSAIDSDKLDEFLSSPQRLGLYSYVLNNPLRYTDPNGLEERTKRPTFLLSKEEVKAWSGVGSSLELPQGSESWTIPSESGTRVKYESDNVGATNALPPARSGWQRVTVVLRITGPDGKPVAGQHFRVDFSRPGKYGTWGDRGQSLTWGVSDKKGLVTIRANVPPRGGQMDISGFYKDKGVVKRIVHGVTTDPTATFTRVSKQGELRFDVKLKSVKETLNQPAGAITKIKQTK